MLIKEGHILILSPKLHPEMSECAMEIWKAKRKGNNFWESKHSSEGKPNMRDILEVGKQ